MKGKKCKIIELYPEKKNNFIEALKKQPECLFKVQGLSKEILLKFSKI